MRLPTHNFSPETSLVKTAVTFADPQILSDKYRMRHRKRVVMEPAMNAVKGTPACWDIAPIVSLPDLAGWLGVTESKLKWLADVNGQLRQPSHYVCRWIRKRTGLRLIESPKQELKRIQRQILHDLLIAIPPSPYSHGFVRGRNVCSYVRDHVGKSVCVKMDLRDYFPSIRAGRIFRLFSRVGYPLEVSRILTGLCTTATRSESFAALTEMSSRYHGHGQGFRHLYARRHLPQGAPTSPALANFCSFKMDCRLAGLARKLDGQYSRYADDLLFSFQHLRGVQTRNWLNRFANKAAVVAIEEGFSVNFRKTRFMFASQRQSVAGIVLNTKTNLSRRQFDRLKAILHNCVVHGPDSQNRGGLANFRAHLAGRIAWVSQLNPNRGAKLVQLFKKINWPGAD